MIDSDLLTEWRPNDHIKLVKNLNFYDAANVKIDEEGGTRVTDNRSRYLMTGLSLTIAAFAARGEDRQMRAGADECAGQLRACGDEVLAVVQHKQEPPAAE